MINTFFDTCQIMMKIHRKPDSVFEYEVQVCSKFKRKHIAFKFGIDKQNIFE